MMPVDDYVLYIAVGKHQMAARQIMKHEICNLTWDGSSVYIEHKYLIIGGYESYIKRFPTTFICLMTLNFTRITLILTNFNLACCHIPEPSSGKLANCDGEISYMFVFNH